MNHLSANNGSRQGKISIVARLQVLKPTARSLIPRNGKYFPRVRIMPVAYRAHTACYSTSFGNKGAGIETDKIKKDERYIPPFPLRFVQRGFYIHLLP